MLATLSTEPPLWTGRVVQRDQVRLRSTQCALAATGAARALGSSYVGGRKLRHTLASRFGAGAPSVAAINRWLKRWGLAAGRPRRRRGPQLWRKQLRPARCCHDIWTVDFKGWYRTGDGRRVEPLTVRDLYSRYILEIKLLRRQSLAQTRMEFKQLFRTHGLPKSIRCDNGTPFGGAGPTGLTRLSAWWVKLGIEVEFISPGRPDENGAHEQFHRIY